MDEPNPAVNWGIVSIYPHHLLERIMSGWFEISKSKDGQFRFVLKAGNAETILTSELYKEKASAQNGVESVQKNSGNDGRYELKTASNGKFHFNLKAANGQVIGTSQLYATAASRDKGIASLANYGVLLGLLIATMAFVALIVNPLIAFLFMRKNPYPLVL